ncbi:hypothetical protein J4450_05110 [Candidatus Micrarchaeota archaeon]|nr:hypothetical protein [Candidatus Micrarchaeota archaeon]
MIKHEIKTCSKCKKKIFISLLEEKGQLVETQFIGLKKISERKGITENKVFICGLCEKPQGKAKPTKSKKK